MYIYQQLNKATKNVMIFIILFIIIAGSRNKRKLLQNKQLKDQGNCPDRVDLVGKYIIIPYGRIFFNHKRKTFNRIIDIVCIHYSVRRCGIFYLASCVLRFAARLVEKNTLCMRQFAFL